MRIIKILLVLAVCLALLGFWRGWFSVSSGTRDVESNKVDVTLTVDPDKAKQDAAQVKQKAGELTGDDSE